MSIKVAALQAAIVTMAAKFPEAAIEYYNIGFKTEVGSLNLSSPPIGMASVPPSETPAKEDSGTGEEKPAAKKSRKPAGTAAAQGSTAASGSSTTSASGAGDEDLFGSAESGTKAAASTSGQTAQTSASPSEDDIFGENAAPAKQEAKKPATIEQLRKALTEVQTKHGHKDHALGILKKHTRDGNPTISTLDEAKYQDVIDACAKYVPAK